MDSTVPSYRGGGGVREGRELELPNSGAHLFVLKTVPDPFRIESGVPILALPIVRLVLEATVDASGLVGACCPFGGGEHGGFSVGVALAATHQRTVEFNGMGAVANRAVPGLEGAGLRI